MATSRAMTALIFAVATATVLSGYAGDVQVALSSDESCTSEECGLELRQLRGQQVLQTDDAKTLQTKETRDDLKSGAASGCAQYCQYEGAAVWQYDADCKDCTVASFPGDASVAVGPHCASHCQYEGSATWQYDPDCTGCSAALVQTMLLQTQEKKSSESTGCESHCQYEGAAT